MMESQLIRRLVAGTAIVGLLLIVGIVYQSRATRIDRATFPAPGDLVVVNGKQMHLHCKGNGSPMVLLEGGLNQSSLGWTLVHEQLADVSRICAYDRAGLGYSDPVQTLLTTDKVVEDLSALLTASGIDEPVIMVGMSAGGLYVREFFRRYPERVVGMGLIDSAHEHQARRMPYSGTQGQDNNLYRWCSALAPFGIVRATGLIEKMMGEYRLPDKIKKQMIASYNQNHTCGVLLREELAFQLDLEVREAPGNLGQLPLVVVSRGRVLEPDELPTGMTMDQHLERESVWRELQLELLNLSSNSKHIIAEESRHVIQFEQPERVIQGITDLIRMVRTIEE
jgi:pimeloyl-ACP methyl ester carboxylesterase